MLRIKKDNCNNTLAFQLLGFHSSPSGIPVTHLQYAGDTILFLSNVVQQIIDTKLMLEVLQDVPELKDKRCGDFLLEEYFPSLVALSAAPHPTVEQFLTFSFLEFGGREGDPSEPPLASHRSPHWHPIRALPLSFPTPFFLHRDGEGIPSEPPFGGNRWDEPHRSPTAEVGSNGRPHRRHAAGEPMGFPSEPALHLAVGSDGDAHRRCPQVGPTCCGLRWDAQRSPPTARHDQTVDLNFITMRLLDRQDDHCQSIVFASWSQAPFDYDGTFERSCQYFCHLSHGRGISANFPTTERGSSAISAPFGGISAIFPHPTDPREMRGLRAKGVEGQNRSPPPHLRLESGRGESEAPPLWLGSLKRRRRRGPPPVGWQPEH
ncbi:hypothetical protein Taro_008803 [Colocasia esculenta]|uniref:Uncharacterized protein n=1 Tax=Colocasia esculenta TaxID=4460 RepID=A0A843TYA8_COLES|nr:hypothetical protein [Colocasia esculenta]